MTRTGKLAANSAKSNASFGAHSSSSAEIVSIITGRMCLTLLGPKAPLTDPRRRWWSGPSRTSIISCAKSPQPVPSAPMMDTISPPGIFRASSMRMISSMAR